MTSSSPVRPQRSPGCLVFSQFTLRPMAWIRSIFAVMLSRLRSWRSLSWRSAGPESSYWISAVMAGPPCAQLPTFSASNHKRSGGLHSQARNGWHASARTARSPEYWRTKSIASREARHRCANMLPGFCTGQATQTAHFQAWVGGIGEVSYLRAEYVECNGEMNFRKCR